MVSRRSETRQRKDYLPLPDGELARLRARLAQKQEYIAVLEVELFNTRAELSRFTEVYNSRISPLEQRVNRLRKALYKALEKQKEEELPTPPDYSNMGSRDYGSRRAEQRKRKARQRARHNHKKRERDKDTKRRNPKLEERIKDLFRMLAKRFHPDLTGDPEEKHWREGVMAQVNQAYTARDLDALLSLAEHPSPNGGGRDQSRAQEMAYLKEELKRLDGVIEDIEATLKRIELSSAWRLHLEVEVADRRGRDLLAEMAADFTDQIDELEEHLYSLGVEPEAVVAG